MGPVNTWNYVYAVYYIKIRPFTCTTLSLIFRLNAPPIVFVVDRYQHNDKEQYRQKETVKQTVGKMPTPHHYGNFSSFRKRKLFFDATAV
jgi:hypothetical protein